MLKIILIGGLGFFSVIILMGLCVVIIEHLQHRKKQNRYDDLHRSMGLDADHPPVTDEDRSEG